MEKLKRRYSILNKQIADCWSVIDMIQAMNENLRPRGRVYKEVTNDEARGYLYRLEESLTIDRYEVEKQIVQKILKLIESGMCLYTDFIPYKYPANSSNQIHNIKYILCEYDGYYYLMSGNKDPNVETYLIFIYDDLTMAVDAFYKECNSFIEIRKDIDARFDLTPEQRAELEKKDYNDIPPFNEILQHFHKSNGTEPSID